MEKQLLTKWILVSLLTFWFQVCFALLPATAQNTQELSKAEAKALKKQEKERAKALAAEEKKLKKEQVLALKEEEKAAKKEKSKAEQKETNKEAKLKSPQEEEQALKAELKKLQSNLEQYHQMKEEAQRLEAQIAEAEQQLAQKEATKQQARAKLSLRKDSLDKVETELYLVQKRNPWAVKDCSFRVQVGAYTNQYLHQGLHQYANTHDNFQVEEENDVVKYSIGLFPYYWEAKYFSKLLDKMGAQTYVIGYFKEERIPDLKDMTQCTF